MDILMKNKIVVVMIILVIGAVAYYFFFATDDTVPTADQDTAVVGRRVIDTLETLQSVDLERRLFDDGVFRSLEENRAPIPAQTQGRPNPFEPINE